MYEKRAKSGCKQAEKSLVNGMSLEGSVWRTDATYCRSIQAKERQLMKKQGTCLYFWDVLSALDAGVSPIRSNEGDGARFIKHLIAGLQRLSQSPRRLVRNNNKQERKNRERNQQGRKHREYRGTGLEENGCNVHFEADWLIELCGLGGRWIAAQS